MPAPYLTQFSTRRTPQSESLPGQVPNSAGGHAWAVDDWTRLNRFLVLGCDGSYYANSQDLTRENAQAVVRCVGLDGPRTVRTIVEISVAGRAPKNDPAIFALAMCAGLGDDQARRAALNALPGVCRTGTHLFSFATYVEQFRGWGRGLRRAVGAWYQREDVDALAYQVVKYRQRAGWTHRDLLRLAHPTAPTPAHDRIYEWVTHGAQPTALPNAIYAYESAQRATGPEHIVALIEAFGSTLPREAIPPELMSRNVWDALLRAGMPMTALMRNLATMTRCGLLAPMSDATRLVVDQLGDVERLRKARVHPLSVLVALKTYQQGHGERDPSKTWDPVARIVDALDEAFYASFGNIEPTGKRTMLALDVSGSMGFAPPIAGMPGITPRVGSAAMALVTAATEPNHIITAFCTRFVQLDISPRQRLDDVVRSISNLPFGGTDCALPMIAAQAMDMHVDTFVTYTDSETWAGDIHPMQALREYREKMVPDARMVVCGMVSNGFTLGAPDDPGCLDVIGFDAATPQIISDFSAGRI